MRVFFQILQGSLSDSNREAVLASSSCIRSWLLIVAAAWNVKSSIDNMRFQCAASTSLLPSRYFIAGLAAGSVKWKSAPALLAIFSSFRNP